MKEIKNREKRSKDHLNSETRITSNKIITKRVKEVGKNSGSATKQKIVKVYNKVLVGLSFSQTNIKSFLKKKTTIHQQLLRVVMKMKVLRAMMRAFSVPKTPYAFLTV